MPDYEIKEWNESNFDVNIIPYTKEAYEAKKYAFVSDYARFANAALPLSPVTVTGILEWGSYAGGAKECYHLTMRYEEDCSAY
jgi:hypothetical protein